MRTLLSYVVNAITNMTTSQTKGGKQNGLRLWIDDIRKAPDDTWHVARNVTEAIRCIAKYGDSLTHISFDHDASHGVNHDTSMEVSCPCDFTAVAYFLGEYFQNHFSLEDCEITIHSANPIGAENIKNILEEAQLFPEIKPITQ